MVREARGRRGSLVQIAMRSGLDPKASDVIGFSQLGRISREERKPALPYPAIMTEAADAALVRPQKQAERLKRHGG